MNGLIPLIEKIGAETDDEVMRSSIAHVLAEIKRNNSLGELLALGIAVFHPIRLNPDPLVETVAVREWHMLASNIQKLLDIQTFPDSEKRRMSCMDQIIQYVEEYSPMEYHPHTTQQLDILKQIQLTTLERVINFNYQYHRMVKHMIAFFKSTPFFEKFNNFDCEQLFNDSQVQKPSKKISDNINRIYKSEHQNKRFISIDLKQANATTLFLLLGVPMVNELDDFGMGFETVYASKEEMMENFNWSVFVELALKHYPLEKIVEQDLFDVLSKLLTNSKMVRQIVFSKMCKDKPDGCESSLLKICDTMMKLTMFRLANEMKSFLKDQQGEIMALSADEIILRNVDYNELMCFLNEHVFDIDSMIIKHHLHVKEFYIRDYRLKNGCHFFLKDYTHDEPPTFRMLNPRNKLEALQLIANTQQNID